MAAPPRATSAWKSISSSRDRAPGHDALERGRLDDAVAQGQSGRDVRVRISTVWALWSFSTSCGGLIFTMPVDS